MRHPHLVRVLNYFEMHQTAYLVMDYYEGEVLAAYLKRQPDKRLFWRRAVQLMLPVLDGLQKVHEAGFMHRDIKPGNLYLTGTAELILLDFGAAREVAGGHTHSREIYSEGYAPYEQCLQSQLKRQGPWTDVYGVAATLYFMLTAQRLPSGLGRWDDIQSKRSDPLQPARRFVPALPSALNVVLGRALKVEPEKRLQSAQEFKQQLEAMLATEVKKPSSNAQGVRKPPRKLNARAATIALSLALLGWGGWLILSSGTTTPQSQSAKPTQIIPPVVESPHPPVPPLPVKGTVAIRSEPLGATIRVNGALLGSAPQDFVHPEGRVTVEARLEGYEPRQEAVWIMAGRRSDAVIRLEPVPQAEVTTVPPPPPVEPVTPPVAEPAVTSNPNPERTYLTVKTEPPGAQVRIMNIGPAYRDGIELVPGDFDIEVSAPGYQTDRAWHTLAAGAQELKITLPAEPSVPTALPQSSFEPEMCASLVGVSRWAVRGRKRIGMMMNGSTGSAWILSRSVNTKSPKGNGKR